MSKNKKQQYRPGVDEPIPNQPVAIPEEAQVKHSVPAAVRDEDTANGAVGQLSPQPPTDDHDAEANKSQAADQMAEATVQAEQPATDLSDSTAQASSTSTPADSTDATASVTEASELKCLESVVAEGEKKHREAIEALRTIREQKFFRLHAADAPDVADWPENGFDSFDDYMECRWRRTRNWATQEINWLRACECLEAAGKGPYQFSKQAIQSAAYLLERDPEGFCQVYLGAAAKALPVTENAVKESLKDYQRFVQLRDDWDRWQENAKVLESERVPVTKDEAALLDFPWNRRSYATNLVDKAKAKETGRTWQECLPEICQKERMVPMPVHLLAAARGDDLKEVVQPLGAVIQQCEDHDRAAKEADELNKRAREIRQKYGVQPKKRSKSGGENKGDGGDNKGDGGDGGESKGDGGDGDDSASAGEGDEATEGEDEGSEAEGKIVPEPAEVVKAMEKTWETELSVAYLLRAGVECWEVAFRRLDPTTSEDKEAALEIVKQMTALVEQVNGVEWV